MHYSIRATSWLGSNRSFILRPQPLCHLLQVIDKHKRGTLLIGGDSNQVIYHFLNNLFHPHLAPRNSPFSECYNTPSLTPGEKLTLQDDNLLLPSLQNFLPYRSHTNIRWDISCPPFIRYPTIYMDGPQRYLHISWIPSTMTSQLFMVLQRFSPHTEQTYQRLPIS